MRRSLCSCGGITKTSELVLQHFGGVAFQGIWRLSHHNVPKGVCLDTSDSSENCSVALTSNLDRPTLQFRQGRRLIDGGGTCPSYQASWPDLYPVEFTPQITPSSPPCLRPSNTAPCYLQVQQHFLSRDFTPVALLSLHHTRYMATWRRMRDAGSVSRDDGNDDRGGSGYDRPRNDNRARDRGNWRIQQQPSSEDSWGEQIAGGGSCSSGSNRHRRRRHDADDAPSPDSPPPLPMRPPQPWRRNLEGISSSWEPAGGGRHAGQYVYDRGGGGDLRRPRQDAQASTAAETPNRQWRGRATATEEAQYRQDRQHQQQKTAAEAATEAQSSSVLVQLSKAKSLRQLEALLDSIPAHVLGPPLVATAAVAYSRLVNRAAVTSSLPADEAAAAGFDAAAHHHYDDGGGGGGAAASGIEAMAAGLRGRLQTRLVEAAPALGLKELSYCLYGLATLPRGYRLLTVTEDVGRRLSNALLSRLEASLYELADKLRTTNAMGELRRQGDDDRSGSGSGVASGGFGEGEHRREAYCLTYLCTALRRLHVVRLSVHRALAAAAAPLLGNALVGEALPPLVLGFLEAGNPEPLFMEQLVHQSSLPYSLARTNSVFACTVLLRAAGQIGAEPAVVGPLATRLTDLLKQSVSSTTPTSPSRDDSSGSRNTQPHDKPSLRQTETEPPTRDAVSTAVAAALSEPAVRVGGNRTAGGGEDGLAAPAEQQQQQWRRLFRPTREDYRITYALQACEAAGLGPDSELVQVLLNEVKRRQSGWDVLHRLMTARHLNALGVNVVTSLPLQQPHPPLTSGAAAAAEAVGGAGEPPAHVQAAAAGVAAGSRTLPAAPADGGAATSYPQQPSPQRQQQQLEQLHPAVPMAEGSWSLIKESEVLSLLQSTNITIPSLLAVLYGLAHLRVRPERRAGCGVATPGPVSAGAGGEYEYGMESTAAGATASVAVGHVNRMPTALGVAVQLVDAAAPVMAPRQVIQALVSLAAAGVTVAPPLLQRAEHLYRNSVKGAGAGASGAPPTIAPSDLTSGKDNARLDAGSSSSIGGGGIGTYVVDAATTSTPGSEVNLDHQKPADAGVGGGGSSGRGPRDLTSLCAMVGRVLAWQPAPALAAILSDDFVRHCRTAALGSSRSGTWTD